MKNAQVVYIHGRAVVVRTTSYTVAQIVAAQVAASVTRPEVR